jgi:mannose-6-phosphate isomerase class I
MGKLAGRFRRFPLLLKFLDAREMLSVQVHPSDARIRTCCRGRDREDRSMGGAGGGAKAASMRA